MNDKNAKFNNTQRLTFVIFLFTFLFFVLPFPAFAGAIHKPPNNLGLTGYWTFNDGNGSIAGDSSSIGRHGTLTNMDSSTDWVSGKRGKALNFDGTDDYVNTNTATSKFITATDGTISVWLRPTGTSPSVTLSAIRTGATAISTSGLNMFGITRANVTDWAQDAIVLWNQNVGNAVFIDYNVNEWIHVVWVHTGGMLYGYKNGELVDSIVSGNTNTSSNLYMGNNWCCNGADGYWQGDMDEVRIYNRALSATEILALSRAGSAKIGLTDLSPGTLKNGLTGHWTFDGKDMVTNVADVSGNGRHGTLTNFTSTTTAVGKIGQALKFDGVNDSVETNSIVTNFFSTSKGTISAWVRPTGTAVDVVSDAMYTAPPAVSSSGVFASFGIMRANNTDLGEDRIWAFNYDGTLDFVGTTYNANEWAHITWVHTGSVLSIYKNGEFVGSTASGNSSFFTGNLRIGTNWAGTQGWWNGDLDDVRTWNRALSASEIKQVYNIGAGQKVSTTKTPVGTLQTGLVGHWTFDGKDMYSNVADVSGSGNNGTLTNFPATTTVPGKTGQALNFGGGYVSISNTSGTLKPGTSHFSVSLWYNGGSGDFVTDGGTIGTGFWVIGTTKFYFSSAGLSGWASGAYTLPSDNEWHHLVLTLNRTPNPDTYTTYLDGAVLSHTFSGSSNGQDIPSTATYIGRANAFGVGINRTGPMDDVRIYNRVLSASEVLQLYNLGK